MFIVHSSYDIYCDGTDIDRVSTMDTYTSSQMSHGTFLWLVCDFGRKTRARRLVLPQLQKDTASHIHRRRQSTNRPLKQTVGVTNADTCWKCKRPEDKRAAAATRCADDGAGKVSKDRKGCAGAEAVAATRGTGHRCQPTWQRWFHCSAACGLWRPRWRGAHAAGGRSSCRPSKQRWLDCSAACGLWRPRWRGAHAAGGRSSCRPAIKHW